jgi:hypothetical protein
MPQSGFRVRRLSRAAGQPVAASAGSPSVNVSTLAAGGGPVCQTADILRASDFQLVVG